MLPHSTDSLPRARFAGLDGLRAVAVTLVIVYHLFPTGWLKGGFVGVDVFFVISGFLITSLLLREREDTSRISLGAFWRRRARRLLPALALLLAVCSSVAWVIGGDVLVDLRRQLVGAVTFSYNWLAVFDGADYFSSGGGELFRNLWSLAVEEQFYLLWPLLLPLLLLLPRTWMRAGIATIVALASAVWMGVTVAQGVQDPLAVGADVTRAYFGTDTHAFGLLLGVALALVWQRLSHPSPAWMRHPLARGGALVAGVAATAGIVVIATLPETDGIDTFPGALLGASALTVLAIVAGCWPGSWFGRAIDVRPLRWIGDRSYGLYLWHWPVLVLVVASVQGTGADHAFPAWIGALTLVITIVVAELSYRLVETPIRRHGLRAGVAAAWRGIRTARPLPLTAGAAVMVLVAGTAAAFVAAPSVSTSEAVVEAGIDALEDQKPAEPEGDAAGTTVSGDQITAVGDSVMLASASGLLSRFPGIEVDAAVSRSMYAAPGILRSLAAAGALRPYVVIGLGTNGSISTRTLDEIVQIIGPDRQLIVVTASAPRDWIAGVNADLAAFARTHRSVQVADWAGAIAPRTDLLAGDQVHPGDAGGEIYASAVADAIMRAERARARLAAFTEQRLFEQELRRQQLFQPSGAPALS